MGLQLFPDPSDWVKERAAAPAVAALERQLGGGQWPAVLVDGDGRLLEGGLLLQDVLQGYGAGCDLVAVLGHVVVLVFGVDDDDQVAGGVRCSTRKSWTVLLVSMAAAVAAP